MIEAIFSFSLTEVTAISRAVSGTSLSSLAATVHFLCCCCPLACCLLPGVLSVTQFSFPTRQHSRLVTCLKHRSRSQPPPPHAPAPNNLTANIVWPSFNTELGFTLKFLSVNLQLRFQAVEMQVLLGLEGAANSFNIPAKNTSGSKVGENKHF